MMTPSAKDWKAIGLAIFWVLLGLSFVVDSIGDAVTGRERQGCKFQYHSETSSDGGTDAR